MRHRNCESEYLALRRDEVAYRVDRGRPDAPNAAEIIDCGEPPVRGAVLHDGPCAGIFPNRDSRPLNLTNLRERVWRPALRRAGLRYRSLYQTRHTFVTLMLGAGESPAWIARQLGHTTPEMLFRRYHRFIPNLTRRDGSAASRWLEEQGL